MKLPGWLKFVIEAVITVLKKKGVIDPNVNKKDDATN